MARILVYGAGVIGSLYACLFSKAGESVTVYARGKRLEELSANGLRYFNGAKVCTAKAVVTGTLKEDDIYDFILLAVRENQLHEALAELKTNQSHTIITMVNSLEDYSLWEKICGEGRIMPAFPGAGGSIENGILRASLTPGIIQPTTFGEPNGKRTKRSASFAALLKRADIPYQIVPDMHIWQLCHLALVIPLADAYYEASDPTNAGKNRRLMRKTAERIRENFRTLTCLGIKLSPAKMQIFRYLPLCMVQTGLMIAYRSSFGDRFMYQHSMKAPDEMRALHDQLYSYIALSEMKEKKKDDNHS